MSNFHNTTAKTMAVVFMIAALVMGLSGCGLDQIKTIADKLEEIRLEADGIEGTIGNQTTELVRAEKEQSRGVVTALQDIGSELGDLRAAIEAQTAPAPDPASAPAPATGGAAGAGSGGQQAGQKLDPDLYTPETVPTGRDLQVVGQVITKCVGDLCDVTMCLKEIPDPSPKPEDADDGEEVDEQAIIGELTAKLRKEGKSPEEIRQAVIKKREELAEQKLQREREKQRLKEEAARRSMHTFRVTNLTEEGYEKFMGSLTKIVQLVRSDPPKVAWVIKGDKVWLETSYANALVPSLTVASDTGSIEQRHKAKRDALAREADKLLDP
jgi:hypothetical protein